jgi:SAM-dependent methyltransferase
MDDREVAAYWNGNAESWVRGVQEGWDVYREHVIGPGMGEIMPPVQGLRILDIGCGEGAHTRSLAERGARMVGVDVSEKMIAAARQQEKDQPRGIEFHVAAGNDLHILPDSSFDAVVSYMAMMDMAGYAGCISEVARILRPGGWLQFVIAHPCMDSPICRKYFDEAGQEVGRIVGNYFGLQPLDEKQKVSRWFWHRAPAADRQNARPFEIPRFYRTVSEYVNTLINAGLNLTRVHEPYASEETVAACPAVADTRVWPYMLVLQARKPA